ncbi:hypothetical protein SeMB42_g06020 [Synchytrium endobioticum]|uniref:Uncharacterized protein n=1 Tax=Synchytrium endobioticum TaxID=286115 RepID=A0A507CL61_9FUNG|nr:hypothetical protein SeMB42_g06020 [Synchytrium endobioticum]
MPRLPPPTRTDIAVVTRMAKFITISLLVYVAAYFCFTPVEATDPRDMDCIRHMIFAVTNPTGTEPLSHIRDRIEDIFSSRLSTSSCLRSSHSNVFDDLKKLFTILAQCIQGSRDNTYRPTLYEALALVCFHINMHYKLEDDYRRPGQERTNLVRPAYDWEALESYRDENAYLESVRSAISKIRKVNDLVPGTSNTGGGGPAPVLPPFSETPGALPAPSSSSPALPVYCGTRHDGPDYGYALPHGSAPMLGSTNPGIQLSEGYTDPEYLQYENEFGLPAYEQVGPSSSGTLNVPYDYGYAYDSAPMFGQSAVSETPGALPAPPSSSPALPVYCGTRHDGPDSGYDATAAATYVSDPQGALPAPSSPSHAWPSYSGTLYNTNDFEYAIPHDSAPWYDSTSFGADQHDPEVYLRDCQKPG